MTSADIGLTILGSMVCMCIMVCFYFKYKYGIKANPNVPDAPPEPSTGFLNSDAVIEVQKAHYKAYEEYYKNFPKEANESKSAKAVNS